MRLLRITTNPPAYLGQFFGDRPELAGKPYGVQHAALLDDCYAWADFWSRALERLGYECDDIIANAELLQREWAREHSIPWNGKTWLLDTTSAQVKAFRPEVLFVNDYHTFTGPWLKHLRSECKSIRLVLGWCGAPYNDPAVFREYDAVLSCIPELVQRFRESGHRCHHLNHAFEPRILARAKIAGEAPASTDFAFLGSIVKREQYHTEREKLLLALIQTTDLRIWAEISRPALRQIGGLALRRLAYDACHLARRLGCSESLLGALPVLRNVARWPARPGQPEGVDPRLARRAQPPLYGVAMFQQLHASRIVLNTHIDVSARSASNMRLFEATGVGTCMLTDWKVNLPELFDPASELATYRDPEECREKAGYLLEHDDERRALAAAGQRRTLRDHTFAARAVRLDEIIRGLLP